MNCIDARARATEAKAYAAAVAAAVMRLRALPATTPVAAELKTLAQMAEQTVVAVQELRDLLEEEAT